MLLRLLFVIAQGYIKLLEIEESPQITIEKYSVRIFINSNKYRGSLVKYLKSVNVDSVVLFCTTKGFCVIDTNGKLSSYDFDTKTKWMFIYFKNLIYFWDFKIKYENINNKIEGAEESEIENYKDPEKQQKNNSEMMPICQLIIDNNFMDEKDIARKIKIKLIKDSLTQKDGTFSETQSTFQPSQFTNNLKSSYSNTQLPIYNNPNNFHYPYPLSNEIECFQENINSKFISEPNLNYFHPKPTTCYPNPENNYPNPVNNYPNPVNNYPNSVNNYPNPVNNYSNTITHQPEPHGFLSQSQKLL
ncbi:hypothetical protein DMUE_0058 [Dictyocoela muelleri]|nr:hypothetical protein DMUE_0058 [Dictyocoela muelleri]